MKADEHNSGSALTGGNFYKILKQNFVEISREATPRYNNINLCKSV